MTGGRRASRRRPAVLAALSAAAALVVAPLLAGLSPASAAARPGSSAASASSAQSALSAESALSAGSGSLAESAGSAPISSGRTTATTPTADGPVAVDLTSVSAPSISPGSSLTVRGVLRNTGSAPIRSLHVHLRVAWEPLDRAGIAEWAARTPSQRVGADWTSQDITGVLAPGGRVAFTLTGQARALGLPTTADAFGPRGMAVEAYGDSGGGEKQLAVQRTFLVWDPQQGTATTRLSILAPVTSSAGSASADAGAVNPTTLADWAPSGRLSRVVAATHDPVIAWAVDPALLSAAAQAQLPARTANTSATPTTSTAKTGAGAPAANATGQPADSQTANAQGATVQGATVQGSTVQGATVQGATVQGAATRSGAAGSGGTATPAASASVGAGTGTGAAAGPPADPAAAATAKAWTTLLTEGSRGRDLYALPWADPDVAALAHAGATSLFGAAQDDALAATRETFGKALDVTLGWPGSGLVDKETVGLLARNTGRAVVLSDAAVPARADGSIGPAHIALPGVRPDVTGLVADTRLSESVAAMAGDASALATQRVLAELAGTSVSAAADAALANAPTTAGRDVLAALPRGWDPQPAALQSALALLRSASWVQIVPLDTLRSAAPTAAPKALRPYPAVATAAELPPGHVSDLAEAFARSVAFAPALTVPDAFIPAQRRAALSLAALTWRRPATADATRERELAAARQPLLRSVDALYAGVSVSTGPTTLLARTGHLPVTVTSKLGQPVNLLVVLRPRSGRLLIDGVVPVALQAGGVTPARSTVPIGFRVLANGDVDVDAWLSAPGSTSPLVTASKPIVVHIRQDWEDRGLVVAGAVLVLLFVLGLFRSVRKGRRRLPPSSAPDPDDVGSVRPAPPREPAAAPAPTTITVPADDPAPLPTPQRSFAAVSASGGGPAGRSTQALPPFPTDDAPRLLGDTDDRTGDTGRDGAGNGAGDNRNDASNGDAGQPPQASGAPSGGTSSGATSSGGAPGDAQSLARSSAVMTAGTLVSRILGMVRVAVLSAAIGASVSADAFNTANTLPNNLFILIGGGVLNAVLVPQIVRAARRSDGGKDFVDRLLTLAIVILGGAAVLITVAAPLLVRLYSKGWDAPTLSLGTAFALWCLPQIFFYGLYTIYGQVLNARGSFGPYMWAPVVNNVVAIAGMLAFIAVAGSGDRSVSAWSARDVALLAGTTTLGVVAQALVLVPVLTRSGYTWRPRWGWRGIGLRTAGTVAAWTFAGVALAQAAFVVTSQIATAAGYAAAHASTPVAAGRTVYDYAYLLFMLPHSLVAVSVVTAVFTRMSTAAGEHRDDDVRDDMSLTVRTVGVASVLATIGFLVLKDDVTFAMFLRTPQAVTHQYALVAAAMMLGLVPFSAQYLFQRVFYAYEDARTPFLVTAVTIGVWTVGNLVAWSLLPARWVVVGIGVAMAVGSAAGAAVAVPLLRRRLGDLDGPRILRTHLRLTVAAVGAGALAWLARAGTHAVLGQGRLASYAVLVVAGSVLLVTYTLVLRALKVTELDDLLRPLTARLRPSR